MAKEKKQVIIIMGAPGSGKGTQAELLAERFNFYYFETSKILEEKFHEAKENEFVTADGKKYYLKNEKVIWQTGGLCSPPMVTVLVMEKIRKLYKEGKSLILSGSPRTVYESEKVIPMLKKTYGIGNIKIILLQISPSETIFRNSHRRICELMRHPVLYSKENEKLIECPLDGSKLLKREGLDDPKSIKVRLEAYKERTLPLLEHFKKEKLTVKKINGSPAPAIVFKNVLKALK